ncbi:hypothetical protein PR202_ga07934 [Eleusine coracana subsp. coracana]|uniref:Uncharacterized protein n=1 Tax=Eleusine coracana subsp. coracana TaxID=191504 RepID=A0AAV5C189_ELECO|nr:hypothetical protein PR202_ga07934 [Eleusine coracana subsp. coracana]
MAQWPCGASPFMNPPRQFQAFMSESGGGRRYLCLTWPPSNLTLLQQLVLVGCELKGWSSARHSLAIKLMQLTIAHLSLLCYYSKKLFLPNPIKLVWLRDFQFFGDKSGAINPDTGNTLPHDESVMEVTWGLKNLMYSLVSEEKSQLAKGDRLQMSLGLKMLLNRYGFDVKPEMVSDPIIVAACALYHSDDCDKKVSGALREAGNILKDVSHINCDDWDLVKLATAVKMISFPKERAVVGNPHKMFSTDELSKLVNHAPRYKTSF